MIIRFKKAYLVNLILMVMLLVSGCGAQDVSNTEAVDSVNVNSVFVCYPKDDEIVKSEEAYQLKQPDSIVPSVEEVMSVSLEYYGGNIESYSYMVDDNNNVTLDITVAEDCSREYALLTMASVSDTMFQIDMVESVRITLLSKTGESLDSKLILRNTIYHYGVSDKQDIKRVTFYKKATNGESLEALSGTLVMDDYVSMAENVVVELEKINAIPEGTKVNSLSIISGVCYLDLSKEFEESVEDTRSDLVVYALVNSITGFSNINKVLITIDGDVVNSYRGSVDLSKPLSFNNEIIK